MIETDDIDSAHDARPRHAAFFALSAAVHALVIAAIVALVPAIERPHAEWVLAYLSKVGGSGDAGARGAAARGEDAAPAPAPHIPRAAKRAALTPPHQRLASLHRPRSQSIRDAATSKPPPLTAAKVVPATIASRAAWSRGTDSVGAGSGSGRAGAGMGSSGAGDGIAGDSIARADYGQDPAPPYPSRSRRRGEQGTVMLHVLVGADGSVERVEIAATSGFDALDDAALATVRGRWRFVPARRDGVPAESWVMVPIRFALTEASASP